MRWRLASRLVVLGIVQLVLLAATAVIVFVAEGPHEPPRPERVMPAIHALEAVVDDPPALQRALDQLREERVEASLYDGNRQLVASNVDPPLAIPFPESRRPLPRTQVVESGPPPPPGGPHRLVLPMRVHDSPGVLVARGVHGEPPGLIGPVIVLVCGFVILVVGALLTARWIVRPIERLSKTARALGAGDLGARSRLERDDEIGDLGRRVDEMADRIERLLVTEKELLANVAHELRTPLTRIGVALDLAGEGDAEAARASLEEIAVDVSELEQIVDDILTAMRFEIGGTLPMRRAVVAPASIALASAERLRARHTGRPLEVSVAADLPSIDVDPMLLRRVLDNLVENAHKYTPDGGASIDLQVVCDADAVVFSVRDHGIGIMLEDLPRVFTAFFRSDRSRSREGGGVGLGLTLAKRIVEAHGGAIAIASTPGVGTTVTVRVPSVK
jgi:signal transduction histidine kinase